MCIMKDDGRAAARVIYVDCAMHATCRVRYLMSFPLSVFDVFNLSADVVSYVSSHPGSVHAARM